MVMPPGKSSVHLRVDTDVLEWFKAQGRGPFERHERRFGLVHGSAEAASATLTDETLRRRTFAIISHPDAGKAGLTEKCCCLAGRSNCREVKARAERRRVNVEDPMKTKHLRHALDQLAEECVTRVFKPPAGGDWIIGAVGAL